MKYVVVLDESQGLYHHNIFTGEIVTWEYNEYDDVCEFFSECGITSQYPDAYIMLVSEDFAEANAYIPKNIYK